MLSTEANFVKISAIFFSLACVAEVILPRLLDFKQSVFLRIQVSASSQTKRSGTRLKTESETAERR